MKRIGLLIAAIALAILGSCETTRAEDTGKEKKAPPVVVPVFSLQSSYTELPAGDNLFGGGASESFQAMLGRLKKVRDAEDVKCIVLLADSTGLGNAQIEEVRNVLAEIKKSGKEIHAHATSIDMRSYVLLSGATHISVVPTGDVWLTGLFGQSLHIRGLLDMIGVQPDFMTCGDYKSAAEMFTKKQPSPEAEKNLNWLLDGVFENYVGLIAEGRGVKPKQVRAWIDQGLFSAKSAAKNGIVDGVMFQADFEQGLKSKFGEQLAFSRDFGKKTKKSADLSSPLGLLQFYTDLLGGAKPRKSKKDAIAIVHVEGPIMAGSGSGGSFPLIASAAAYSTPIRKALDKVAQDDSVKAVVLRVNSPGGSAVASEIILQATRRVKAKKPFVVSMGDVAGSGGYYVACGSDTIFADPSTVTGSIGVVGGKLATHDMWGRAGITWKEYARGKRAGILNSSKPFTEEEREVLQGWMDEIYEVFKGHVTKIRGDRLKKDIDELAGGRVYTGRQALELGLVDKLGGLGDAIAHVAKQAKLDEYELRVVPRPKNFAELLVEAMQGDSPDKDTRHLSLNTIPLTSGRAVSLLDLVRPYLKGLEPSRLRLVETSLRQLEVLRTERAVLAMPVIDIGG